MKLEKVYNSFIMQENALKQFSYKFTLDPKKFERALWLIQFRYNNFKLTIILWLIILAVFNIWQRKFDLFIILFPFVYLGICYYCIKKNIKNSPALSEEMEYKFTEDGFHTSTRLGKSYIIWEVVKKVMLTKNFLFIFVPQLIIIFPKSAIPSKKELNQLCDFLKNKVPKFELK